MKTIKERLNDLDSIVKIQKEEPSIKTEAYMAGLYNGLLLAQVTLSGGDNYNPISYREHWLIRFARKITNIKPTQGKILPIKSEL